MNQPGQTILLATGVLPQRIEKGLFQPNPLLDKLTYLHPITLYSGEQ